MKRISTFIIAAALLLELGQCKKQETSTTTTEGERVHITLKVGNGDRHIVYPGTGAVAYSDNDIIYVGNNHRYVGYLTCTDGVFSGSIVSPSTTDYLHFYFVGGLTPSTTLVEGGEATSFTVNISNQSSKLPVLSYGHTAQNYTAGTTTYTCVLENKCGLVKFVPSIATSLTMTVSGMKTTATIDFANNAITPEETTGDITLYTESDAAKWAILLPQNAVINPNVTVNGFDATMAGVPEVNNNLYYSNGVAVNMIDLRFSVNASEKVVFSKGNLQYQASSQTWRFAENQWDCVGKASNNNSMSSTSIDWVDLFGWGTWGSGKNPLNTSTTNADYTWSSDFSGTISNDNHTGWRTLTKDEWKYVFDTRTTTSGIRYAKAQVNEKNGVILLPDHWDSEAYTLNNTNTANAAYTSNPIIAEDWMSIFEVNGAVFLPDAGQRTGTMVVSVGSNGAYWSSTENGSSSAYSAILNNSNVAPTSNSRSSGNSVRLVRPVN